MSRITGPMRCVSALYIVLGACFLLGAANAQGVVSISSISPSGGSYAGGTRLVIQGQFYGMMEGASNTVYIGPYPCKVIMHLSSETVLTCETTAGSPGRYQVSVLGSDSESFAQASTCCFEYQQWGTPTLSVVVPQAGPPGQQVQLYGAYTWQMQQDCGSLQASDDATYCLSGILFQDYRCRFNTEDISQTYADGISLYKYSGWSNSLYRLNCTMPDPSSTGTLDQATFPGLGVARSVNTTVRFEASLRGGMPAINPTAYVADKQGWPYMYQVYAVVESVSPAMGSVAGGTTLTIQGRGFPNLELKQDTLYINVAGMPCSVRTSTYTTITCVTKPAAASYTAPAAINGVYAGARGLELVTFNTSAVNYNNLWRVNNTVTLDNTNGTALQITDRWETPVQNYNFCSRSKAFFIAPRSGPYTFMITSDDFGHLNASWYNANVLTSQTIAYQSQWSSLDTYTTRANQRSSPIQLDAGQRVLLEAAQCNTGSIGHQQVGVLMPSSSPSWAAPLEVQQISITGDRTFKTIQYRYSWPIGSAVSHVVNVTITATQAWLLTDPRVGVNLMIDGSIPVSIPITAGGEAATTLLGTALSITNTSFFGVSRYSDAGKVIFQLAVNKATRATFAVTAQLGVLSVTLPTPYSRTNFTPPQDCMWFNPAMDIMTQDSNAYPPAPELNTLDASILSAGATAAATSITLPAVSSPAGSWSLVMPGNSAANPVWMSFSIPATNVSQLFAALTGISPSDASFRGPIREGAYLSNIWTIRTPLKAGNDWPHPMAILNPGAPSDVIATTNITSLSSDPISGSFSLALDSYCDSVIINLEEDTADAIAASIRSLPYINGKPLRRVTKSGDTEYGWTITITFDPVATPGDVPELVIINDSLTGTRVNAVVKSISNGTADAMLMAPIPTEFLRFAVPVPNTIDLLVNDIPSACTASSGPAGCTFTPEATISPSITSVSPTTLAFGAASSLAVTITGTLFSTTPASNNVTIGGAPCAVTSATATQLVCTINAVDAPAGQRTVNVLVGNIGYATGAPTVSVQTLRIDTVTPATVSSIGMTALNITGRGFDGADCAQNLVTFGSIQGGVLACDKAWLHVLFYDSAAITAGTTPSVTVQLVDGATVLDTATKASAFSAAASAPALSGLSGFTAGTTLPGSGFNLTVQTDSSATAADIVTMWAIPAIPNLFTAAGAKDQHSNVSAAWDARVKCKAVTVDASDSTKVMCTMGSIPNGWYTLAAQTSSKVTLIMPGASFQAGLFISSVSPAAGSIGGNTLLTITGSGFNAQDMSGNVVLLPVPVSTTLLNGVALCDVVSATPTQITCRTRAHLAADASATDTLAQKVKPASTISDQVTVVACEPGLSDILKLQCWSQGKRSATAVSTNPANTEYSYDWTLTPTIASYTSTVLQPGQALGILGAQLTGIAEVHLRQSSVVRQTCAVVGAKSNATYLECTLPNPLPAGSYTVLLKKSTAELSVDMSGVDGISVVAYMVAASPVAGSLAGGRPLTLTVNGTTWNSTDLSNNQVLVGGAPCAVTSASGSTLTCTPGSILGRVQAEYWNVPSNNWNTFPDIINYYNPVFSRLETGIQYNWGSNSPAPGIGKDWFAARFTFYLQVVTEAQYNFFLGADDRAKLYVNELYLGERGATKAITLSPGHVKVQVTYIEYAGSANLNLQWDAGVGTKQTIPWWRIFPFAPGTPAPITARINGANVLQGCTTSSITLPTLSATTTPEDSTVQLPGPQCSYVFSSYLTPTLTSPIPTAAITSAVSLNISGMLMGGTDTSAYTITVGGAACPITQAVADTTISANTINITCTLPTLPAGTWPVLVSVANQGYARPVLAASSATPSITLLYGVGVATTISLPEASPDAIGTGSYLGGSTFTLSGWGYAATGNTNNKTMQVKLHTSSGAPAPTTVTVVSATATSVTLSVNRFQLTSLALPPATPMTSTYQIFVYDAPLAAPQPGTSTTVVGQVQLVWDGRYTPKVTALTPTATTPTAADTMSLTWTLGIGSTAGITTSTVGAASVATVELQSGSDVFTCANPTVSATSIATNTMTESLSCTLPAYLPAGNYTVWVCYSPIGCGYTSTVLNVPLTVTAATPSTGSAAGGQSVTITGSGFSTTASALSVSFGSVPCAVTSATATQVVCTLGKTSSLPAAITQADLLIRPTAGSMIQAVPSVTFTFDPAQTPVVSSISPNRGSTAGGTLVTITGSGFPTSLPAGSLTVLIANNTCTSPTIVSSTTITCTTSAPVNKVPNPLPLAVSFAGMGFAWSFNPDNTPITYHYVDLWSRKTTWGGKAPPVEGDSVMIPANTTVMLDVSTPVLGAVVCEGNLIFDDTQPATEIHLQANWILVKGGNLSIGSNTTVYPGKARITLYGPPYSRELPLYGAKTIALREGNVVMRGKPKTPTWTLLASTADVGASSIQIQGPVNWVPGDVIVVASSSFFANETDMATVVSTSYNSGSNITTLTLDQPFNYTHLGITIPVSGDPYGRTIDMRAEVAVLSRNIIIEGDESSAEWLYGGQIQVNTPRGRPRAQLQLEQVEIRRMGQAFRLGRYAIHWHMHGDVGFGSWLKGLAIHHTYNRAATIHGTHQVLTQNCVAYDIMGHAFFLEDGIETGNIYDGNLGMLVRRSDALLITDTTPAVFWVTHPNNTYRNNRAAGSTNGYGFWYRFLQNPEGPSTTTTVCPKFTPMGVFENNVAHSNMFYGLRVHPEYVPKLDPCGTTPDSDGALAHVPATFNGLLSYKNGMKGAIATQVGAVRFANMTLVDNGGGPRQHVVNGKDNGAGYELTWVVDDRNRANTSIYDMSGLFDSLVMSKTTQGNIGTAGRWPSGRKITGVIMHSPAEFHVKHTALGALVNVTFVNYPATNPGQFKGALEVCGKCKNFQGGATTFTKQLTWIQPGLPFLSEWSWGHQGVFQDTDGTLLNADTLPADLVAAAKFPLGVPNTTWHSAVDSTLFDPAECVYVRGRPTSNNGSFCSNALQFRRVMIHDHAPPAIKFRPLLVTSAGGAVLPTSSYNGTSVVYFTHYNEDGYQFTVPTKRDYLIHWQNEFRLDPSGLTYHKPDPLNNTGWVTLTNRLVQKQDHLRVNNIFTNITTIPTGSSGAKDGDLFYNKSLVPDGWWYGNMTYNSTAATTFVAGNVRHGKAYTISSFMCPPSGCNNLPDSLIDLRDGILYWSDPNTWNTTKGGKPKAGDNVTIPYGWNLVVDENPDLSALIIQGNLTFDTSKPIVLTAQYILVMSDGQLTAGSATDPFLGNVTIRLNGTRQTPDWALANDLNLGSKVLAAVQGGRIELHGMPVKQRWTRLASAAAAASSTIVLASPEVGWSVGQQVLITSTSWNPWQAEIRTITAIAADKVTLTLDTPLTWPHSAKFMNIAGAANGAFDMRAEVALISSNIVVTAVDGPVTQAPGGEMFGCRIIANGASLLRMTHTRVNYCGQGGLMRPAVMLDRMSQVSASKFGLPGAGNVANPSFVRACSITNSLDAGLQVVSTAGNGIPITDNVLYMSYDRHTLTVTGTGNTISGNLALGTIKDMTGKSSFDKDMPSTFAIESSSNVVTNNVAAGGERVGFLYNGIPCTSDTSVLSRYANNSAHSYLVGAWLRSSKESEGTCTALYNFTTYLNWDFGIISTDGITTDVELTNINIADSKFANLLILRKGAMNDKASVNTTNLTLVGQSGADVCNLCNNRVDSTNMDPGCHPKLARRSYNQQSPFTPVKGILGSVFALKFTPGPEPYPWDGLKGYAMVYGVTRMVGTTLANFYGSTGCSGKYQTHALGNHAKAPEAFHPVFMTGTNVVDVTGNGMTKFYGPDPEWRNEADCDTINWSRTKKMLVDNDSIQSQINDPSVIQLNCQGPLHVNFRDEDGSLTGKQSSILGQASARRSYPFDQGTPVIPGPCQFSPVWQGYSCLTQSSAFELDAALKPNPVPAKGIFGDPQHFVLESRDADSEDRNFSPVMFNVSGVVELSVAAMDHGWCFAYTCQKRLSTFWTYLPSGHVVNVSFTGTPSRVFRLYWPYADPDAEIVLVINYQYTPNRRFSWSPSRGRLNPLSTPPTIGDGKPHGSFYWDQDHTLFYVKLKGSAEAMEVRTENALMVSQSLAVSFDQFFDVKEMFLSNLAFLLGIPISRIQVASIIPGSTVLKYMLYDAPAASAGPIAERTFDTSNNVDPQTATFIKTLPADQQDAWLANVRSTGGAATSTSSTPSAISQTQLIDVLTKFVNLPSSIGNITVLASSVDLAGALLDPELLALINTALGIANMPPPPPGERAAPQSLINIPIPAGGLTTPSGSEDVTAADASTTGSGGSKSNRGVVIGAVLGSVGGMALVAAAMAVYIKRKRDAAEGSGGGTFTKIRVTPENSESGAAPDSAVPAARGSATWAVARAISGSGGSTTQVAPEPNKKSPLGSKGASAAGIADVSTPPGTPGREQSWITTKPDADPPSPAPSRLATRLSGPTSGPASPGSPMSPLRGLGAVHQFPRAAPPSWNSAAQGRAALPAIRPDGNGTWQTGNLMVAANDTAPIEEVGFSPAGLPGARSAAGPGMAAAAADAVKQSQEGARR